MSTIVLGISLGLGAGVAPGPLLALVVTATLERGFGAGARVACAPLLVDAPVIVLSVLVLDALPEEALGAIALGGGLFVGWLGATLLLRRADAEAAETATAGDLRRGALVNLISPHRWLFWIAVGGPALLEAGDDSAWLAAGFLVTFYALLVGTKLSLAAVVAGGRRRLLDSAGYAWALRGAAVLLVGAGALLALEGLQRLA